MNLLRRNAVRGPTKRAWVRVVPGALLLLCGCEQWVRSPLYGRPAAQRPAPPGETDSRSGSANRDREAPRPLPLPVQQAKAYPETTTGLFVSLADFESIPGGPKGFDQVKHFRIDSPRPGTGHQFVVNITRTGAGALAVRLAPGSCLVFRPPGVYDFSPYTLLSLAVHSESLRDDLRITLTSDEASWSSHRTLVKPGWNNVLVDIQRLGNVRGFDLTGVRTVEITFADAAGPVGFHLDDILLINNRRTITPAPPGIELHKSGLDYRIDPAHGAGPIHLRQCDDGLWRLGAHQPLVQLASPGEPLARNEERLEAMGRRKVGTVEVLESNAVRLRIANTWYFPARAGEWASLDGVRRIRWEYTFYGDGRWVTHIELNNAGGRAIGAVRIRWPRPVEWDGQDVPTDTRVKEFAGIVERWSCLLPPPTDPGGTFRTNYASPGKLRRRIAAEGVFAPADTDRNGFDESQGCYFLAAERGHCRFTILPPAEGLLRPVFRVLGRWAGPVSVNSQGLAVREVVRLADGSVLFALPGLLARPTEVELAGRAVLWEGK